MPFRQFAQAELRFNPLAASVTELLLLRRIAQQFAKALNQVCLVANSN